MKTKYADSWRAQRAIFPHIEKEESWTELGTLREAKRGGGVLARSFGTFLY